MKLVDLNPRWAGYGGKGAFTKDMAPIPERSKIGMSFDCPCGYVGFANPVDGGPPIDHIGNQWTRTGETFEDMSLTPSILQTKPPGCGWHGYLVNGEMVPC